MGAIREPTDEYVRVIETSRRWDGFRHRSDDIFVSTPPKSGTTWTQGIIESMLWPDGDPPGDRRHRRPWIDVRSVAADEMLAAVDALPHRRMIKTHSPADCVPLFEECRYVVVYRDARDTVMSWANHRANMRPEVVAHVNDLAAADGLDPIALELVDDMDALIDEWEADQSPVRHLASWWPLRDEPFVTFVHYDDLHTDMEGEMRRIADFLGIEVPDDAWPRCVERCSLDAMRQAAEADDGTSRGFKGGAAAFFYKGTKGRWRNVLTDAQLARIAGVVADGLSDDAAEWLEHGSLALGRRP